MRIWREVMDHWDDFVPVNKDGKPTLVDEDGKPIRIKLTAGQRNDLAVLAENMDDLTRDTYGCVHADYIRHRVNKKEGAWKNTISWFMRNGILTYAKRNGKEQRGNSGRVAQYHLNYLCPTKGVHYGSFGQCEPPTGPVDNPEKGHPTDDPIGPERVTPQMTQAADWVIPQMGKGHLSGDPLSAMSSPEKDPDPERTDDLLEPQPRHAAEAVRIVQSADLSHLGSSPKQLDKLRVAVARALAAGYDIADRFPAKVREARKMTYLLRAFEPEHLGNWATIRATHPALPPACPACLDNNPGANSNPRFRHTRDGVPCPNCHPDEPCPTCRPDRGGHAAAVLHFPAGATA